MLKLFTYILGFTIVLNVASAKEFPFDIKEFEENVSVINNIILQLDQDNEQENMYWKLTLPERHILATKLVQMDKFAELDVSIFQANRDKTYKGIVIQAKNNDGDTYSNLRLYNGKMTDNDGNVVRNDPDRSLEFWLLGTAQTIEQQYVIASILNVVSFKQCRMLGNRIVATKPRQCFLPTGDILMEVSGGVTEESLLVNTFDECLQNGQKLIKSFPRKCIAAGGRIFMEQRRKNVGRTLKEYVWE